MSHDLRAVAHLAILFQFFLHEIRRRVALFLLYAFLSDVLEDRRWLPDSTHAVASDGAVLDMRSRQSPGIAC